MDLTDEQVAERGRLLRSYAEHFAPRDWDWTRDHRIKRITYRPSKRPTRGRTRRDGSRGTLRWFDPSELPARLWAALRGLGRESSILPEWRVSRWRMFRARLRMQNLPDGHLDGGGIIVHWEETGEYVQMVQPSVGSLVADLLEQDPSNPHARAIAAELQRIADRYSGRIRAAGGDTV